MNSFALPPADSDCLVLDKHMYTGSVIIRCYIGFTLPAYSGEGCTLLLFICFRSTSNYVKLLLDEYFGCIPSAGW